MPSNIRNSMKRPAYAGANVFIQTVMPTARQRPVRRGLGLAATIAICAAALSLAGPGVTSAASPVVAGKAAAAAPVLSLMAQKAVVRQTQLAQSLIDAHNIAGLEAALKSAGDAHAKALFSTALIAVRWPAIADNPTLRQKDGADYIRNLRAYVQYAGPSIYPLWALHQAKFILANLTTSPVNRIEYWSALPQDRAELKPAAGAALQLLHLADAHLKADLVRLNNQSTFSKLDKAYYMLALNGQTQAAYYRCFASYFYGLSLPRKAAGRDAYFLAAVKGLKQWASGPASNGVKYPALLLSGKANVRAGRYTDGESELVKAQSPDAPLYIQYAARYQQVVALLGAGHYKQASEMLASFRSWVKSNPKADTASATMGAQLLAYRIAAAKARSLTDPQARNAGLLAASGILMRVVATAPQYQGLIFSHLAARIPANPNVSSLTPVQALAFAWTKAQSGNSANAKLALGAAKSVLTRKGISTPIAAEASLIAGISYGRLGRLQQAAQMNLRFVALVPNDTRAKSAVNLALSQLQQLNQAADVSSQVSTLTQQALKLAYVNYHEKQWAFAYALQLEETGEFAEAGHLLSEVKPDNPLFLDAQYQLVRITASIMNQDIQSGKTVVIQQEAAQKLLNACHHYLTILQYPPTGTSAAALKRARANRTSILFLQAATALDPLREPNTAGRILDSLDAIRSKLSHRLQGILLRYRIRQYQLNHQSAMIIPLIKKYTANSKGGAEQLIRGLIGQYDSESRALRATQPVKAKDLASQAATLLRALIAYMRSQKGNHRDLIYAYRQILAEEYIHAGRGHAAMDLYKSLEKQRPPDLRNFIGFARAAYAAGHYQRARRLYVRIIPKLEPGSDLFWSAYLYLIRANEKHLTHPKATVRKLRALLAIYGNTIGGKRYHAQYEALLQKYNITE